MKIRGLLIDLDGVIYNDSQPIPGAVDAIRFVRERNIPFRFITNTTMKSREALAAKLNAMGISAYPHDIFSAASAGADFLRQHKENASFLLLTEEAKREYAGIPQTKENACFVVVGDLGNDVSISLLNDAFNCLMRGAQLVALQKNRFWLSDDGYKMDAGAFVAMLEYAANVQAILIGKPSAKFFDLALRSLNLPAAEVMMIGDDIESDIAGATSMGMKTCLVKTGKYREIDRQRAAVQPQMVLESIAQLPELLA